ncbi:MAG TPA: 30S ribosome-binding factor RbfA [Gemmatimonadales bacterium]|nr:30S ribosome-binding factor RbfA [Gemmatimonadales bacterium]
MTRPSRYRPERLAALVQAAVADALATEVKDPRVGFVTVTGATVAMDASVATIHVSIMGSDDEKAAAMDGLNSARGFLRSRLARSLALRNTPELHFVLDRTLERAARIDRLLDQLKRDHPEP